MHIADQSIVWLRPDYHSSASISRSIDASLRVSGLTKEDVDLHCFYSCVDPHRFALGVTDAFLDAFLLFPSSQRTIWA